MNKKQSDISYQKYLFHRGENYRSYEFLGAFPDKKNKGVLFRVWAPRARAISLVTPFFAKSIAIAEHSVPPAPVTTATLSLQYVFIFLL